jgi:hypothetical protein
MNTRSLSVATHYSVAHSQKVSVRMANMQSGTWTYVATALDIRGNEPGVEGKESSSFSIQEFHRAIPEFLWLHPLDDLPQLLIPRPRSVDQ